MITISHLVNSILCSRMTLPWCAIELQPLDQCGSDPQVKPCQRPVLTVLKATSKWCQKHECGIINFQRPRGRIGYRFVQRIKRPTISLPANGGHLK
jgi:hypothetical protein